MLELYKIEVTPEKLTYYYQPEGEGEMGIITYYYKAGRFTVEKKAEKDGKRLDTYITHSLMAFSEYVKKNEFPEKDMRAWY